MAVGVRLSAHGFPLFDIMNRRILLACCFLLPGAADVRSETLDVFIMAGQSNMKGSANVQLSSFPADQATTIPGVLYTHLTDDKTEGWGPLQPRFTKNGASRRWVGSELTFGDSLLDAGVTNAAIIKYAISGTSLDVDWAPGGDLRTGFYSFVDNSLAELASMGHAYNLAGFVWVQGSGDAQQLERSQNYDENLAQFIGEIEGRYNPTTTILNRYHIDSDRPYVDELRASQRELADGDADVFVVNTDDLGLNNDNIHFQDSTDLEVGRRLADRYLRSLELRGDYNADGAVNAADYTLWRDSLDSLAALDADGDGDGVVEVEDYTLWRDAVLSGAGQPAFEAVPEPSAPLLAGLGFALVLNRRYARSPRRRDR